MRDTQLNRELTVTIPDGFHEMDDAELSKLNLYKEAPDFCISDAIRHITVTVAWKKSLLGSMVLKGPEVAKKMEAEIRKPMEAFGYSFREFVTVDVGGETADGFIYEYTAQERAMVGESFAIKKGKTFYYIHCYMRDELKDESMQVVDAFFRSFQWA